MIKWLGHRRDDNTKPLPEGAVAVKIHAKKYTEKDVVFTVPRGKAIKAWVIPFKESKPDLKVKGERITRGLYIETRNATEEELRKSTHPRHPKLIDKE